MVKVKEDMTGWKMWEHGVPDSRLTVIRQIDDYINPTGKHYARYECVCDCGSDKLIKATAAQLRNGQTKSCGCLKTDRIKETKKKYNSYDLSGQYGVCYLDDGSEVLFDLEDYEIIKDFHWYLDTKGYVQSRPPKGECVKHVSMHRLVMGVNRTNPEVEIDHIEHNKLDNRKSKLRKTTKSQNMQNQKTNIKNTSGVKGVSWCKATSKWRAYIQINRKHINLGRFDSFDKAVIARREAEEKYFGEYSYDNSMTKHS